MAVRRKGREIEFNALAKFLALATSRRATKEGKDFQSGEHNRRYRKTFFPGPKPSAPAAKTAPEKNTSNAKGMSAKLKSTKK